MHLLIAFLLTVLASVFAQAQDAASSAPSPAPSPAPASYSSCHVDGPYIAMTFDDGPSPGNTTRLLDILKQRNIKVTFFMIGPNVVAHPEIARRALAEGHEIGNHSWTHPQLSKLSDQRVTEEITKTQEAIKNACGFTPTLLRRLTEQSRNASVSGLKINSDSTSYSGLSIPSIGSGPEHR
jgi:peptidoglycan-N-acetylglucosamine deacetylase